VSIRRWQRIPADKAFCRTTQAAVTFLTAFADGNGTTLQNYLKHFAGYDTAHIIPEKLPRF